jgi:hypothetical protein
MTRASLLLSTVAALAAVLASGCTTDDQPDTSPGRLTQVKDQSFACTDSATDASWACTVELTVNGSTLTSTGVHNDGSQNGPRAVATLSETALGDLSALVATLPLQATESEGGIGCGAAPVAMRNYTIDFDVVGVQELAYHTADPGPLLELKNYVTGLITAIDTCTGNAQISFASCSPRISPE